MKHEVFMKIKEVIVRSNLSRSTIYRKIKTGTFPRPYELSEGRVGWRESEINAWCESRMPASNRLRFVRSYFRVSPK